MREPIVLVKIFEEVVRAAIPVALIFGWVHWTDAQTGTILVFIGVLVGAISTAVSRSQVTPVTTANEQIRIAIKSPSNSTVPDVVEAQKEGLNVVSK